jgi:hypothetical protein
MVSLMRHFTYNFLSVNPLTPNEKFQQPGNRDGTEKEKGLFLVGWKVLLGAVFCFHAVD